MIKSIITAALLALSSAASSEETVLLQYPPNTETHMLGMTGGCPSNWQRAIDGKTFCEVPRSVAVDWIINDDPRLSGYLAGKVLNDAVAANNAKHAKDPVMLPLGGYIAKPLPAGATVDVEMHREPGPHGYPANVSQGAMEAWRRNHKEKSQ